MACEQYAIVLLYETQFPFHSYSSTLTAFQFPFPIPCYDNTQFPFHFCPLNVSHLSSYCDAKRVPALLSNPFGWSGRTAGPLGGWSDFAASPLLAWGCLVESVAFVVVCALGFALYAEEGAEVNGAFVCLGGGCNPEGCCELVLCWGGWQQRFCDVS